MTLPFEGPSLAELIVQRGAIEPEARLTIMRERLTAYGLELDRLERNPTSRYPYQFDVLPQEHAA